ncbi:MAG: cell division protein [Geminicoccaceae bacterium]|nr:MAG: cell division protein [Geminicoccaceae bacterium]
MSAAELDLPLDDTPASRFLAWLIGGLVFLAVLACAVAIFSQSAVDRLAERPRIVTVALPAVEDPAEAEAELAQVRSLLEQLPGVAWTALVSKDELDKLVEPWIGRVSPEARAEILLPRLLDVRFQPGVVPDVEDLTRRVRAVAPGAMVEETSPTGGALEEVALRLRWIGGGAGLLVLLVLVVAVVVVTRSSLDLHDETVDLLRLLGAPDRYVARQFELHAMASALRGGSVGFALALATILGLVHLPALWGVRLVPVVPRPLDWILLAIVPVLAALLITLSARLAAVYGLARLR